MSGVLYIMNPLGRAMQTSEEVEDPSPRYVHIPDLMSLKHDKPNKDGLCRDSCDML